jgi:hypothetical protein
MTRATIAALTAVAIGLPVLLLSTTSWPHAFIAGADALALLALWLMHGAGFQAGYRDRDELAYQHAIDAVRFAQFDTQEGN